MYYIITLLNSKLHCAINLRYFLLITIVFSTSELLYSQSGWEVQNIPFTSQGGLTDVQFINSNIGWFCGQFGKLYRTTNSGSIWENRSINNFFNYNCIFFVNENTGWVGLGTYFSTTYRGMIIKTTNGGDSWSIDTLAGNDNIPNKITFANSSTGWIASLGIYRTTDTGESWSQYFISGFEDFGFRSISFPDINTGYCTGDIYYSPSGLQVNIIAKSTNSGINWSIIKQDSLSTYNTDLQFLDVNTGYLCRNQPIKTTNGGLNWFNLPDTSGFYSMYFINANTGWFGKWGGPVITTNGGLTFTTQSLPITAVLHGIFFINSSTGWGVGLSAPGVTYPKVFKTTAGGFIGINVINNNIPGDYFLYNNFPNPFNPSTKIKFDLAKSIRAELKVYDVTGREISILVNDELKAGTYEVEWYASDYPSGVYFYKLEARQVGSSTGDFIDTKRMVLIK
jgi:photosystem II stability/assembly factor-like uncharacterized protein